MARWRDLVLSHYRIFLVNLSNLFRFGRGNFNEIQNLQKMKGIVRQQNNFTESEYTEHGTGLLSGSALQIGSETNHAWMQMLFMVFDTPDTTFSSVPYEGRYFLLLTSIPYGSPVIISLFSCPVYAHLTNF